MYLLIVSLQDVFGGRLVKEFMFESDFVEDPVLPSPNMLMYKILVKNKKLCMPDTPVTAKQKVSLYGDVHMQVITQF